MPAAIGYNSTANIKDGTGATISQKMMSPYRINALIVRSNHSGCVSKDGPRAPSWALVGDSPAGFLTMRALFHPKVSCPELCELKQISAKPNGMPQGRPL